MNTSSFKLEHERTSFLIAVVGAALILLVTLLLPLGFDNDVYESMAWTLYAYHGLPYLASWDMNFPGIVFIHWASIALFGANDFGFRLLESLIMVSFSVMYFQLLRRWLNFIESGTAVLLFALYYVHGALPLAGQRDVFAIVFLIAAVLLLYSVRDRVENARERTLGIWIAGRALLLGIATSAAILIRPTYGLFSIAMYVLLWDLRARWKLVAIFTLGHVLVWVVFLLPYSFYPGGFTELYDSTVRFNLDLYSHVHTPNGIYSGSNATLWVLATLGFLMSRNATASLRRPEVRSRGVTQFDRKLFFFFGLTALISPIVMGKYFTYHLLMAYVMIIPLSAYGAIRALQWIRHKFLQRCTAVVLIILAFVLMYPGHLVRYYRNGLSTGSPLHYTHAHVLSDSLFGLDAQEEVVRYVDRRVSRTAVVEYATVFSGLTWRLARPEATRFTTLNPLAVDPASTIAPKYVRRWRREFVDSLRSAKPVYLILCRSGEWWPFAHGFAFRIPHDIPGFDSLLTSNYRLDTVLRGFELYRLHL